MGAPGWIATLSNHRPTRRQVSRALSSGGFEVRFVEKPEQARALVGQSPPSLMMIDADNIEVPLIEALIAHLSESKVKVPIVLLSLGDDKRSLLDLLSRHEIGNLVAKHGAIRAAYPVLDERELLVTCMKVVQKDIFGIDKYVGGWGIEIHSHVVKKLSDKQVVLDAFEGFLTDLDAPSTVVPDVMTSADELILNAVVHAPHDAQGRPRYEDQGPVPTLTLQPEEYVTVSWGCDGQRLMFSVTDNFGRLSRPTLFSYLARAFQQDKLVVETKAGGAGLGLSMAFLSIHQLVFNVCDRVRTEAIAGWYLRVNSALEFRQVGKSLNLFWLPSDAVQPKAAPPRPPPQKPALAPPLKPALVAQVRLAGRIDEHTDLTAVARATSVDLREVRAITSRGVVGWMRMVQGRARPLTIIGLPEALVRLASEVKGVLKGCAVATVMVAYECPSCSHEQIVESALESMLADAPPCAKCGTTTALAGLPDAYQALLAQQKGAGK